MLSKAAPFLISAILLAGAALLAAALGLGYDHWLTVANAASAKGENLEKAKIGELYLTDGNKDFKAVITEQSETEIKFKVPQVAAGRYRLMIVTANRSSMLEQPVVITVE